MQARAAFLLGLLLAFPMSQAVPAALEAQGAPASLATPAAPPGQIAGRVTVEGANAPLAGARVMLFPTTRPAGPMGPPAQTVTDQGGRFVFTKLAPGSYRLNVQKTGFAPLIELGSAPATEVNAGQTTEIALRLQVGAVIAGKVLDASGEPMSDLRVMAMRRVNVSGRNGPGPGNTPGAVAGRLLPAPGAGQQTNDLGEFRIASLAPGEYYVAAMPRGFFASPAVTPTANGTTNVTTYYPGTLDQAAAQAIKVAAGETINNIVFSMQTAPAFRVSGRVVDENGAPVAGAMVMLMGDPRGGNAFMGPVGNARTGDDGRFMFGDVPSGAYRVNASVPVMMNSAGGAIGGSAVSSVAVGGGATGTGVTGSVIGGSVTSWNSGGMTGRGGAGSDQPADVIVDSANVTGIRVVVRRPAPQ